MVPGDTCRSREVWGILGGMGPLASAEFLKTIYEETICGDEQNAPIILMRSDPTIPDRTETLLSDSDYVLLDRLTDGVGQLLSSGANRIVICCLTIHPLIAQLPAEWQPKIVSLVDLIYASVLASPARHLLVCTTGARHVQLFERHPLWPQVCDRIVFPSDEDQRQIHQLLYAVKQNRDSVRNIELLEALVNKYGVSSYIAGCTEAHILAKQQEVLRRGNRRSVCLDPLTEILPMIAGRASAQTAVALST